VSLNVFAILVLFGGWFCGRLFDRLRLPSVLGMVVCGLILGVLGRDRAPASYPELEPFLKSFALIVILLRAGLGIHRETLNRTGRTALLMSFIPGLMEGGALTVVLHILFDFAWPVAGLCAFMLAAVSPAVIVPSMLDLLERGYGKKNEVPTIVLAGASVDDVFAITVFSFFLGLATTGRASVLVSVLSVPVSILLGVALGLVAGTGLVLWFQRHHKQIRATEKTLILLTAALLLVEVGDRLHVAALLGVMTVGFLLLEKTEVVAHELSHKLARIWVFAQIVLFVLIGFSVDPQVAWGAGLRGLLALAIGLCFRSLGVWLATLGSPLSRGERLFCVLAYIPKATVQAAIGGVALSRGLPEGELILALAVLSIVVTAPLGLIAIRLAAPRLLSLDLPRQPMEYEET
jgi:NhaP-type Na+/H+ or K+/H+ antiporter